MVRNGFNLGTAWVSITPSMRGVTKQITSELAGVDVKGVGSKLGSQLGRSMGESLSKQLKAASTAASDAALDKTQSALERLATAERNATRAREGLTTATKRLQSAEQAVKELREKGASPARIEAAENRVAKAAGNAAKANLALQDATGKVADAKQAAAEASDGYRAALERESTALGQLSAKLPVIGEHLQGVGSRITAWGDRLQTVGRGLTNHITLPALGAATAVASIFAVKGWDRLVSLDTASAKLSALKFTAAEIDGVMVSALASVKGTSYGLGDAATAAASALAAGIKPGKDLTDHLTMIADAAAISGLSMADMGAQLNQVGTIGKAYTMDLRQLGMAGVDIYGALSEVLGINRAEVEEWASAGKISAETFFEAVELAVGGSAKIIGEQSFVGAIENVWSAVGRVGEAFLDAGGQGGGFFSQVKPLLVELRDFLDEELLPKAEDLGVKFGETFGKLVDHIRDIITWWSELDPNVQRTIGVLSGIAISLGPALLVVGKIAGAIGGALTGIGSLVSAIGGFTAPAWLTGMLGGGATAAGATAVHAFPAAFSGGGAVAAGAGAAGAAGTAGAAGAAGGIMSKLAAGAKTLMGPWGLVIAGITSMIALSPRLREALGGVFESLMGTLGKLWEGIQPVFDTLFGALESVVGFLGPVLGFLGEVLGGVLEILSPFVDMLGAILVPVLRILLLPLELFGRLVAGLVPSFGDLTGETEDLIGPIVEVAAAFTSMVSDTVIEWIDGTLVPAIDGIGIAFSGLIEWFGSLFGASDETSKEVARGWAELGQFFEDAWNNIVEVATWAWENVLKPIFDGISWVVTELLIPAFQTFWSVCEVVWLGISTVIGFVWNGILKPIFDLLAWIFVEILMPVFMAFWNVASFVWTAISTAVMIAWGVLARIFGAIVSVVSSVLGPIFSWLYDNIIKPVWTAISDKIKQVGDWFRTNIVPAFESATTLIGDAFSGLKRSIGEAWDAIKRAAVAPVNFIINTVYNDGIAALFDDIAEAVGLDIRMPTATPIRLASGGVLPGYTPGRDVHKFYSPTAGVLHLSGGEGIIRPDALRALGGKDWLDRVNSARGDAYRVHAFADGGVWDWVGETFDGARAWFAEATDTVMSIISDPLGAIRNLILEPVKSLLSGMGGGLVGDILAGIPLQVVGWLEDLLKDNVAQSAVINGYRGGPTLARLAPIIQKYGLVVTDTWGSPEHNAALGRSPTSYHGDWDNPAVDIAGPFSAMEQAANEIIAMGGWRQLLWKVAGHWDHIHVAREGGIFGELDTLKYDQGGYLQPGLTLAYNATGKPEPVLTSDQWERSQSGVTINQHNYMPVSDPNVIGDRLAAGVARGLIGVSA